MLAMMMKNHVVTAAVLLTATVALVKIRSLKTEIGQLRSGAGGPVDPSGAGAGRSSDRDAALAKAALDYSSAVTPNERMLARIRKVRLSCGELCRDELPTTPGPFFDHVRVPVDCDALFHEDAIDSVREQDRAPRELPPEFMKEFTMNGRFPIQEEIYDDRVYLGGEAMELVWTEEKVETLMAEGAAGTMTKPHATYGTEHTNPLMRSIRNADVQGKHVLVLGSETPWVEALCLAAGAARVTTLEYGEIDSRHPLIDTLTPPQFRQKYFDGTLGQFDALVTFSSIEHSGLGRYGDALLPWGDLIAIARGWCVTREGGTLTIGVPYDEEKEGIFLNIHRQYGKVRYPYLTANWEQMHVDGKDNGQRVFNFSKLPPMLPVVA